MELQSEAVFLLEVHFSEQRHRWTLVGFPPPFFSGLS